MLLVGPLGLYEEGLQQVLKARDFTILAGFPTLDSVDAASVAEARIVIVMDPSGETDLSRTVETLRERDPKLRFVLLIDMADPARMESVLRVPAHAFLCQRIACETLLKALDVVLGDGAVLSLDLMPYLLAHPREAVEPPGPDTGASAAPTAGSSRSLSAREVDILRCLTDGASNKLIARRFQIAESTVKIHVKGILRKINVQNRTQAAIWALSQAPAFVSPSRMDERQRRDGAIAVLELHT